MKERSLPRPWPPLALAAVATAGAVVWLLCPATESYAPNVASHVLKLASLVLFGWTCAWAHPRVQDPERFGRWAIAGLVVTWEIVLAFSALREPYAAYGNAHSGGSVWLMTESVRFFPAEVAGWGDRWSSGILHVIDFGLTAVLAGALAATVRATRFPLVPLLVTGILSVAGPILCGTFVADWDYFLTGIMTDQLVLPVIGFPLGDLPFSLPFYTLLAAFGAVSWATLRRV